MPYRTASGGRYDGGDYPAAVATADDVLADLVDRRAAARAEGRLYGIGLAAVVEPSISNMGYITTVLTHDERERAGPKGGALASATVSVDALGGVTVTTASVPQGQGHLTVLSQVVADVFGAGAGGHCGRLGPRHRAGRVVGRVGQLFQPLRRGGRRDRAPGGDAPA